MGVSFRVVEDLENVLDPHPDLPFSSDRGDDDKILKDQDANDDIVMGHDDNGDILEDPHGPEPHEDQNSLNNLDPYNHDNAKLWSKL